MEESKWSLERPFKYPETNYSLGEYSPEQGLYQSNCTSSEDNTHRSTCTSSEGYTTNTTQSRTQSKSNPYVAPAIAQSAKCAAKEPYVPKSYGFWKDLLKNRPQPLSLAASTFIFMSAGMSFARSFDWKTDFKHLSESAVLHMQICWFAAIIIGASIAAIFIQMTTMRVFNILASILVMISGILFIFVPGNAIAVTVARYCDGIAFGLTLIPAIVVGSEQAVRQFRGLVLLAEQAGLIVGILTYLCFCTKNTSNTAHGSLALIYGAVAFGFTFTYTKESPISYLRKGDEAEATQTLCCLQKFGIVDEEIDALLNENKRLLEEDIARGRAVNCSIGLVQMLRLCRFRILVMMSSSLQIIFLLGEMYPVDEFAMLYTFTAMRLIGIILAVYTLDNIGRKGVSKTSWLVAGGLLFGFGILFKVYGAHQGNIKYIARGLLIAYQLLAGLSSPASTCYLGEAYSISVKPYFIVVAVVLENSIQIVVCYAYMNILHNKIFHPLDELHQPKDFFFQYLIALGALQMAFAVFTFSGFPETKQTTLREALGKFA